jgi:hypothetical protein
VGGARWQLTRGRRTSTPGSCTGGFAAAVPYLLTQDHGRAEEAVQDGLVAAYPRWSWISADPDAYVRRCIIKADISRWRRFFRCESPVDDPDVLGSTGRRRD